MCMCIGLDWLHTVEIESPVIRTIRARNKEVNVRCRLQVYLYIYVRASRDVCFPNSNYCAYNTKYLLPCRMCILLLFHACIFEIKKDQAAARLHHTTSRFAKALRARLTCIHRDRCQNTATNLIYIHLCISNKGPSLLLCALLIQP